MLTDKTIAFIGGGNMAEAIIRGLIDKDEIDSKQVGVSGPRKARTDTLATRYKIRSETDNKKLANWADIVVLAVKPQIMPAVLRELSEVATPDKLFVSVAAGVRTATMEEALGRKARVVRAMPNTPALVRAGATVLAGGAHTSPDDIQMARIIFDAVGITEVLGEEHLDAVTGLSGSGPAYIFLVIEALTDAGVKVGLSRRVALTLAAQTVMGSAKLLLDTDGHPGQLKDMVTSPGGTAIVGLHTLEQGGLRTTLINAVEAATRRAQELGLKT